MLMCVWGCLSLSVPVHICAYVCLCVCVSVYENLDLLEHFINFRYELNYNSLLSAGLIFRFLKLLEKDGTMVLFLSGAISSLMCKPSSCVCLASGFVNTWQVMLDSLLGWSWCSDTYMFISGLNSGLPHHVWDLGLWSENVSSEGCLQVGGGPVLT